MAEPNNGLVVGGVRLLVLDAHGQSERPLDAALGLLFAAAGADRRASELRVYDAESHELVTSRRFRGRRSAERARTVLADLAGPDGTEPVDWVGELAVLDDRPY